MYSLKIIFISVFSLVLVSCQQEENTAPIKKVSNVNLGVSGSTQSANADDFSDFKKKDDESCDTKTAEDIEKELAEKAKKAKTQGFSFNSGEPGCDPNAEEASETAKKEN